MSDIIFGTSLVRTDFMPTRWSETVTVCVRIYKYHVNPRMFPSIRFINPPYTHFVISDTTHRYALFSLSSNRRVARRNIPLRWIEKQHSTPNQIITNPTVSVAQKKAKAIQIEKTMLESSTRFGEISGSLAAFSYSLSALTVINDVTMVTIRRNNMAVPRIALLRRLNGRFRSKCQASWCKAFLK